MGFLDRKSRVIDVALTELGRTLFATGELEFSYYAFFDDGIDYDPYSTGTLDDSGRDELIHSTPLLEVPVVPGRRAHLLALEPQSQVFTASPGYAGVPRVLQPLTGSQVDLRCDQYPVDGGMYKRSGTGVVQIKLELSAGALPSEGFSVHIYTSGSDGLQEVLPRRDLRGRRSMDPFIAVAIDDEPVSDIPSGDPVNSLRKGGSAQDPSFSVPGLGRTRVP